jgi:hypothetical protein
MSCGVIPKPDRKGPQERDRRIWRGGCERERGGAECRHRHDQPAPFDHAGERQKGNNPGREADLRDRGQEPDAIDRHGDARGDDRQQGLGIVDVRGAEAGCYCEQPDHGRQAWCGRGHDERIGGANARPKPSVGNVSHHVEERIRALDDKRAADDQRR